MLQRLVVYNGIIYKTNHSIRPIRRQEYKRSLIGGGAGGGKTALGCYWQLKQRLKYPNTRGLIGRAVLKTLKELH